MSAIVNKVLEGSIAEELEIEAGDEIVSIDETAMSDMIDYNYLCKTDLLTIEIKKKTAKLKLLSLKKIMMRTWALYLRVQFLTE